MWLEIDRSDDRRVESLQGIQRERGCIEEERTAPEWEIMKRDSLRSDVESSGRLIRDWHSS